MTTCCCRFGRCRSDCSTANPIPLPESLIHAMFVQAEVPACTFASAAVPTCPVRPATDRASQSNRACTSDILDPIALTRIENTRIISPVSIGVWPYISISYRGVRCPICSTMQDDAQLVHAKFTHARFLGSGIYGHK